MAINSAAEQGRTNSMPEPATTCCSEAKAPTNSAAAPATTSCVAGRVVTYCEEVAVTMLVSGVLELMIAGWSLLVRAHRDLLVLCCAAVLVGCSGPSTAEVEFRDQRRQATVDAVNLIELPDGYVRVWR